MAITITINATDAIELREQLHLLLGAATVAAAVKALGAGTATFDPPQGSDVAAPVPAVDIKSPDINVPSEITEEKQEVKKRRAHRKVKVEPSEPSEPSHVDGAPATSANGAAGEVANSDTSDEDIFAGTDPVEAQRVKDEVLPQLRDLFVSGKVKQVRAILDKFGDGAKSIPEIEAKQFPAIKEFLRTAA